MSQYNKTLAIIFVSLAAAAFLTAATVTLFCSDEFLNSLGPRSTKVVLLIVCFLLSSTTAVWLYDMFYDVPPHRLTRKNIRYVKSFGMFFTFCPLGVFGLSKIEVLEFNISFQEAGFSTAMCLAIVVAGVCYLDGQYARRYP